MARGLFICFEGSEGSGKSTQIKRLAKRLKMAGFKILVTREPGGTHVGEALRKLFKQYPMNRLTELFIIEASRAEHVETIIKPALKNSTIVLCDRFVDSTLVYQGLVRGLPLPLVRTANLMAVNSLKPDLTIWLDQTTRGLKTRLHSKSKSDRFDRAGRRFHIQIQSAYRRLYKKPQRSVLRIDAHLSPEVIGNQIQHAVNRRLNKLLSTRRRKLL